MFFSGAIYPLPRTALFTLGGHAVAIYDFIPATHAVVALNKVLTLGAGLGQVAYELIALVVLSAVYFAAGVWLFQRRHLRRS
jgi:ABC-2 type transport system permease protein